MGLALVADTLSRRLGGGQLGRLTCFEAASLRRDPRMPLLPSAGVSGDLRSTSAPGLLLQALRLPLLPPMGSVPMALKGAEHAC